MSLFTATSVLFQPVCYRLHRYPHRRLIQRHRGWQSSLDYQKSGYPASTAVAKTHADGIQRRDFQ